jgi:4-amino-4-deoxy-L-arabinose transferase-like glycosyltransferase
MRMAWTMWGWDRKLDVSLNPKFFNYPSLTFYIHFIAQGILFGAMKLFGAIKTVTDWRVMYVIDPTPMFLAARAVSVLFAIGTAWIVYKTARIVAGVGAALLALALLAVNPFHVARSQMVEVDVPLTFFVALALYGAVRICHNGRRRDYVWAGIAAGLAASTKYTGALVLVPIALAHFFPRASRRPARTRRARFLDLVLVGALALGTFVATSPYVFLDYAEFRKDFGVEQEHMAVGHFGMEQGSTWMFYANTLAGIVVSVPVLIASLFGIGLAVYRKNRAAMVLASFVVLYLVTISTWSMKADRYLLPALPPMFVLAGLALVDVMQRVHAWLPRVRYGVVVAILCVVVLAADAAGYARHVESYQGDTRTDVADWLLANAESGSYIVKELYGPELVAPSYVMTLDNEMRKAIIERIRGQRKFAVQNIPMFQVHPERANRFYNLDLYPNADYFVLSSGVGSRYRREPERFAAQMAFYDALERQCEKVGEFIPKRPGGLRLTVYRRPSAVPFAARAPVAPPPDLPLAGTNPVDARFYFEIATNYESFGRLPEAARSYELGYERGTDDGNLFQNCVLGEARCIAATKGAAEAAVFVRSVAGRVTDAEMRAALIDIAKQIETAVRQQGLKP